MLPKQIIFAKKIQNAYIKKKQKNKKQKQNQNKICSKTKYSLVLQ